MKSSKCVLGVVNITLMPLILFFVAVQWAWLKAEDAMGLIQLRRRRWSETRRNPQAD